MAIFFEKEEKIGCTKWVRSWSNPSNIFDMALMKLTQAIYYQMRGLCLLIKWEDVNLCDCTSRGGGVEGTWYTQCRFLTETPNSFLKFKGVCILYLFHTMK